MYNAGSVLRSQGYHWTLPSCIKSIMAALWGQYAFCAFLIFQGILCIHLYLTQVSLVSRLNVLEPLQSLDHRGRRNIRSAENANYLLEQNETSMENVSAETTTVRRRKVHRKSHRLPVEKYVVSTESTTAGPIMIRSSRTKLTSSRTKALNRLPEEQLRRVAFLREDSATVSGESYHQPPAVIHFVADTTNYTKERHPHYAGNGRIKVSGIYFDWKPAPWTHTLGTNQHFRMDQGKVIVSQPGLYLFYAQIHYANVQEVNCYRAMHNGVTIAQCCSTTAHPDRHEVKANTCSLLTTLYIQPQDMLWLSDVHERYVILTPEKSYFGLIQLYGHHSLD